MIVEQLYTTKSAESFSEFQKDPRLFHVYHEGYRKQVEAWPVNPLDIIIQWIRKKHGPGKSVVGDRTDTNSTEDGGKNNGGTTNGTGAIIADMGCGEARLAKSVSNKVYSFDLVSDSSKGHSDHTALESAPSGAIGGNVNKIMTTKSNSDIDSHGIIACDIAHVPLQNSSVDIVVFCLSLMGTNIMEFIKEAHRILRVGGLIKIAEVRSRFHNHNINTSCTSISTSTSAASNNGRSSAGNSATIVQQHQQRLKGSPSPHHDHHGKQDEQGIIDFLNAIEAVGFNMSESFAKHNLGSQQQCNKMFFFLEGRKLPTSVPAGSRNLKNEHAKVMTGSKAKHQVAANAAHAKCSDNASLTPIHTTKDIYDSEKESKFAVKPCLYKRR